MQVNALQRHGATCDEALKIAARAPPRGCGYPWARSVCRSPPAPVYLNNCQSSLEVLRAGALRVFAKCDGLDRGSLAEDWWLEKCFDILGVRKHKAFKHLL